MSRTEFAGGTVFTNQDFFRNPAATFERLRAAGPVVEVRFPFVGRTWITTTHELTARVLKDSETFTMRKDDGAVTGMRWWMPRTIRAIANSMLNMDEPDHTRLRSIVDEAFRRRAILGMEPHILAIADELAGQLFTDGRPRRPCRALCAHSAAVRHLRTARFAAGGQARSSWPGPAASRVSPVTMSLLRPDSSDVRDQAIYRAASRHRARAGRRGPDRGAGPRRAGRRPISADEMVAMVFLLLGAGTETTTHLISGSVYELTRNPKLRDWLIGGLEPRQSRGRGVSSVHLAGAVFQAAFRAKGRRPRRRPGETGRNDHGHAGGRQHGPGRE